MDVLIIALLGVLIFTVVLLLLYVVRSNKKTEDAGQSLVQQQLTKQLLDFQQFIVSSMQRDMNQLNENTNDKLFKMEHNVNHQLQTSFEATNKAFVELMKQVTRINQTQDQLKVLGSDITSLHQILNDKKTRGIYGEIELYNLLENAFGDNPQQFQRQYTLSNGTIVDAVIFGNDALGMIPIDSKFPLENFNRLMDASIERPKVVKENEFSRDIKKHIQAIASKYIIPNETSEFAYMFIPAEAIFSYINANMEDIIAYSYQQKVYLVSPTTLMAYITAIKALYLDQKKNEQMQDIQAELIRLSKEFVRFKERMETTQKDFNKVYKDLSDITITANKIVHRFKQIEAVEFDTNEEVNE